jgi:hypothetical protein
MNPVSATSASLSPGSTSGPAAPTPAVPGGSAQPAFRLLLREVTVVGQAPFMGPRLPSVSSVPTPHAPGRGAITAAAGSEARGERGLLRRPEGKTESFDTLPRRYLGAPTDLAAWLPSAVPQATTSAGAPEAVARSAVSLEDLLPALVRRVAWSGDGKRGTVRLEIGSGELAGATLLVHADAGRVRVQLEVPAGADVRSWHERIVQRLVSRDIPIDEVEVS